MGQTRSGTLTVATPTDREIVMTRVFAAPRDLVFEAHSSCEHLSKWWGPRGYDFGSCDMDFRPGGTWRIVQRDPEGNEYGFSGEFRDIARPERVAWTFEWDGMPGHVFLQTTTLEEDEDKTILTTRVLFDTKEDRDGMLQSGMKEGTTQSMDRLEEYLVVLGEGGSG